MNLFRTIGEVTAKPFTVIAEGFLYVCRDWYAEREIKESKIFSEQCDLLGTGYISRKDKIRFLEAHYFTAVREKNSTHDIERALEYFQEAEEKEYERQEKQKEESGFVVSWFLGHGVLIISLLFLGSEFFRFNKNLCHPIDKNVYRNSAYCLKVKQVQEFFLGK